MATVTTRSWLSDIGTLVGTTLKRSLSSDTKKKNNNKQHCEPQPILGILAFETARIMSRLLSLYKSLTDDELNKLRKDIMRSQGVSYLNSNDEGFLLNLACAERIEDLDRCAIAVARLGKKCSDPALSSFENVYSDLKSGFLDIGKLDFVSKEVEKNIYKMEKLISATSSLYSGLEALSELEISDRKMKQWRQHNKTVLKKVNSDLFDQKLAMQRQLVVHYKEGSLWSQTFSKAVGLMARTICIVYARICVVFGPYISVLPHVMGRQVRFRSGQIQYPTQPEPVPRKPCSKSGPITNTSKRNLIRFWSRESNPIDDPRTGFGFGFGIGFKENHYYLFGGDGKKNKLILVAPLSTVGGSGLTLRYANLIMLAETYLNSPCSVGDGERENLYQMLPTSLRTSVKSKLRNTWRKGVDETEPWEDESLAEGWRDALKGIMGWLSPMAQDTLRWHAERNFERQNLEAKPTVLLLQTLHFSDRVKTEAAMAEILVGLSCIFRYENRCFGSTSGSDDEFR